MLGVKASEGDRRDRHTEREYKGWGADGRGGGREINVTVTVDKRVQKVIGHISAYVSPTYLQTTTFHNKKFPDFSLLI